MSELAERAKKLRSEIGTRFGALVSAIVSRDLAEQERLEAKLVFEIEQALLAERRLAITDMANLLSVEAKKWDKRTANRNSYEYASELLRAAAEKEVGK